MTPENLFHPMLGLGAEGEVAACQFDAATGLVTRHVRETPQLWERDRWPQDGGETFCCDPTEELVWRHLNVFEHRCELRCRLPRARRRI